MFKPKIVSSFSSKPKPSSMSAKQYITVIFRSSSLYLSIAYAVQFDVNFKDAPIKPFQNGLPVLFIPFHLRETTYVSLLAYFADDCELTPSVIIRTFLPVEMIPCLPQSSVNVWLLLLHGTF